MQPNPSAFLRGIRQELLQTGNAKLAANDFVPGVTMLRAGEIVSYLLLRFERLPALLESFQPRQCELLQRSLETLQRFGVAVPAPAAAVPPDDAGNDPVARHDALAAAQAACLAALAEKNATAEIAAALRTLMEQACELDIAIRAAREAALKEIRASGRAEAALDGSGVPTDELVTAHLREAFPQYPELCAVNVRQQLGVNTKEVFFMDIKGHPDWPAQAVMRRNRAVDTVGNEVSREFGILDYVHGKGLPAPRPLFAGSAMGDQRRSFVTLERLPGRARGAAELGNEARSVLLDLARNLARLHRIDVRGLPDAYRSYGKPGISARQRTLNMIERFYKLWQGDDYGPSIATESAYIWLREHAGIVDDSVAIVHGDYSLRNNLSLDGKACGILDWELAHEGHPGEDLGYVRLDVEGVIPWSEFMQAYLDAGGFAVPDEVVRYFRIYSLAFIMATLYSAGNGYLVGRHNDMLIGAAGTIEFDHYEAMLSRWLLEEIGNQ